MWFPTDDGFLAMQAQENLARAQMAIAAFANATVVAAAANNASATTNATVMPDLLSSLHDVDPDTLMMVGTVAAVVLFWLTLCGVCRCVVFLPCPCCFCYIPCCYGFCLKDGKEKERAHREYQHYHQHDVRHYPGIAKKKSATAAYHRDVAEIPAYTSLTVDIEEPLLGPPAYSQPPAYEASPPAYHNVPTAPPLS